MSFWDTRLILLVFHLLFLQGKACLGGMPLGYYPQIGNGYSAYYGPYSASRTRMASPSHTYASNSLEELQPVGGDCVQRYPNQKLSCVQPFERRAPSTEHECQQICDEYTSKCRGYQFDSLINQCELFDVDQNGKPRSEQFAAADDVRDDGAKSTYRHRRYANRNPFDEFLRDPLHMMSPDFVYCEPALTPTIGTNYIQSDYNCKMTTTIQPPPAPPTYVDKPVPTSLGRLSQQPMAAIPVDLLDCQDGAQARIQLIDGIELIQAKPVVTVQLDSPDACLHICRLNAHLDGTKFPKACKSSAFDRSNGRCFVFDGAISPNGDLNYSPNANSIYFEKFCIPVNELPTGCDDIIHRIPQHTLDRRAGEFVFKFKNSPFAAGTGAIVTTSTQINCIRQCLSAVRQLGFECMSASYFFDWPSENCYLSRFTRISRPDIYVAERKQFVDYMEMSKCSSRTWQHDPAPSSWSEWSKCDETMTKTRQKNCTGCKQHKEQAPCVSETALELQKSLELDAKKIATNFDSARRYKESSRIPPVNSEEASLFGEQDYDNQKEVSFFGPPAKDGDNHGREDNGNSDDPKSLFTLKSNIRPIDTQSGSSPQLLEGEFKHPFEAPSPDDFASVEMLARREFNLNNEPTELEKHHKQMTTKRDNKLPHIDDHELLKKALEEAAIAEETTSKEASKLTMSSSRETPNFDVKDRPETAETEEALRGDGCDPKKSCCPRSGTNEKSARLRGCVIGYRLGSDGRQIVCITDEYCAQASTATNLSTTSSTSSLMLIAFVLVFLSFCI